MILKKLHDARERLEKVVTLAETASIVSTLLEGNCAHINSEIDAILRYREFRSITAEDLALVALEIRRDVIMHSLGTLREHSVSFEQERARAQLVVDELEALLGRSLNDPSPTEPSEPVADSI